MSKETPPSRSSLYKRQLMRLAVNLCLKELVVQCLSRNQKTDPSKVWLYRMTMLGRSRSWEAALLCIYIHFKTNTYKNVWFLCGCQKMISCPLKQLLATSLRLSIHLKEFATPSHQLSSQLDILPQKGWTKYNIMKNSKSIKLTQLLQTPCPSLIYFSLSQ